MEYDDDLDISLNLYEIGAHSQPYADLDLDHPLPFDLKAGDAVQGISVAGNLVKGTVYEDAKAGWVTMSVAYDVEDATFQAQPCHVGGKAEPEVDGCTFVIFVCVELVVVVVVVFIVVFLVELSSVQW